jgi:GAF domain-containing protein
VLVTRQPLVIDDVGTDERFGREAAESTGYVPKGLMAAPLLHHERALGVLEVLDRDGSRFTFSEMDLLGRFANEAAIALDLLQRTRAARRILADSDAELRVVSRISAAVDALEGDRRVAGMQLLENLDTILREG